jgi:hypothetical protein
MKALMRNRGGLSDMLSTGLYAQPALVPASPWLGACTLGKPAVEIEAGDLPGSLNVTWTPAHADTVWEWVVQTRTGDIWATDIVPAGQTSRPLPASGEAASVSYVAISAVDRLGNQGPVTIAEVPAH